jgi:Immunity protein Imm1
VTTYSACAPTDHDGVEDGWDMAVSTQADVDRLVAALADVRTGTAHIESDIGEFVAQAAIAGGFGYLFYVDVDGGAYSLGDPTSPELASSEQHFPAGSGITPERLAVALAELLTAGGRPSSIRWQPLETVVAYQATG